MNFTNKYRPKTFDEIIGQSHLVGEKCAFRKVIESNKLPHIFLYGEAGVGKTTLAKIVASKLELPFFELNATTFQISELREILKKFTNALAKPLIFIDEVHRLSKTQQEVLLPFMENYKCHIIGASTQNPYYTLTSAIRSRSLLFELLALSENELSTLLQKVCENEQIEINEEAKEYLLKSSGGDARSLLTLLESASVVENPISLATLKALRANAQKEGMSEESAHYDVASAFIKSIRGSDINASLLYLAMMIENGESADFIARRLCILASEDIGNANPNAAILASSILNIVLNIGFPEARISLAQLVIYLASSPKSNSAYTAINEALQCVKANKIILPETIKPRSQNYLYPHDFGGYVKQKYQTQEYKFYTTKAIGFEKTLQEWHEKITKE